MTDSTIDLLPCPFCGKPAHHNDGGNSVFGRDWWKVGCSDCDVIFADREEWDFHVPEGQSQLKYPPKECFDRWNTRTPQQQRQTESK